MIEAAFLGIGSLLALLICYLAALIVDEYQEIRRNRDSL